MINFVCQLDWKCLAIGTDIALGGSVCFWMKLTGVKQIILANVKAPHLTS